MAGLPQEQASFVYFRLRNHTSICDSDPVFLRGKLRGGREAPDHRSLVLDRIMLLDASE
jgi:hypothetical protein